MIKYLAFVGEVEDQERILVTPTSTSIGWARPLSSIEILVKLKKWVKPVGAAVRAV